MSYFVKSQGYRNEPRFKLFQTLATVVIPFVNFPHWFFVTLCPLRLLFPMQQLMPHQVAVPLEAHAALGTDKRTLVKVHPLVVI